MDTSRLRYFLALAKTGSLRKAADLIGVSPPALSKALKLLEQEVQFPLTISSGRGLILTDEGQELADRAQGILNDLDLLPKKVLEKKEKGSIRLGSFEVFTTYFLGILAKDLFPGKPMEVHELSPGRLEEAVRDGIIDLGISYIPVPTSGLEHLQVIDIQMAIYGKKDIFKDKTFEELPFAIPVQPLVGIPNKVIGSDGWPADRLPRNVTYKVGSMESALELCRQGLAVAYLPQFVVDLHNESINPKQQLHSLPLPRGLGSRKHPVFLIKRKGDLEGSTAKKISKALRKNCY